MRIKPRLYYSSYPLHAGDGAAKCKPRAAKKAQGVCGDRQAALSLTDRTSEMENKLQLPHCVLMPGVPEPRYSMMGLYEPGLSSCVS